VSRVLVLDGRSRAALAIVRSLGKHGLEVSAGDAFKCSTFWSKYVDEKVLYPAAETDPDGFYERLLALAESGKYDMIMPVRDGTTGIMAEHKKELSRHTLVPTADMKTIRLGRDKWSTVEAARKAKVPVPETHLVETEGELASLDLTFPVMLKPRESSGSRGIAKVESQEELVPKWKVVTESFGSPLVQEFIPYGGAYGVSMLFNEGKPRASFTHKRLREWPPSGGPSTLRESVHRPEMEQHAARLLEKSKWHGVAMVEFRVDSRDGTPKLMEINPRFWGSLPLAIFAGVDFPWLLYNMVKEGDVEPVTEYKVGVKARWLLLGDTLYFLKTPGKLGNLREFLHLWDPEMTYDILSLHDVGPSVGAVLEGAKSMFNRKRRKHAFDRGW